MTDETLHQEQTIDNQRTIVTPLGEISIISMRKQVPDGWRILTMTQGRQVKQHLGSIIGNDAIVGFEQGRLDGHAYGNQFHEQYGQETTEIFIIKKRETVKRH